MFLTIRVLVLTLLIQNFLPSKLAFAKEVHRKENKSKKKREKIEYRSSFFGGIEYKVVKSRNLLFSFGNATLVDQNTLARVVRDGSGKRPTVLEFSYMSRVAKKPKQLSKFHWYNTLGASYTFLDTSYSNPVGETSIHYSDQSIYAGKGAGFYFKKFYFALGLSFSIKVAQKASAKVDNSEMEITIRRKQSLRSNLYIKYPIKEQIQIFAHLKAPTMLWNRGEIFPKHYLLGVGYNLGQYKDWD